MGRVLGRRRGIVRVEDRLLTPGLLARGWLWIGVTCGLEGFGFGRWFASLFSSFSQNEVRVYEGILEWFKAGWGFGKKRCL